VLPAVVGDASPQEICQAIETFGPADDALVVVSSDLSHYLPYERACKTDAQTAQLIENLELEQLKSEQACGCYPIKGLLAYARKHGLRCKAVHLANSGDTAGPKDRVVGYGAFVFY
jgi:MEMO1 family protein